MAEAQDRTKITNYRVVRNTSSYYTFDVDSRVMQEKDSLKIAWWVEAKDVEVSIEDGYLMFDGPQKKEEEHTHKRAFIKLSKMADNRIHEVDKPPRGGLFVTVMKKGATETPPPLDDHMTGRAKPTITGPDGQDWSNYKPGDPPGDPVPPSTTAAA